MESESECDVSRTRFSVRGGLQPRALVSYPRSGNTWIRSEVTISNCHLIGQHSVCQVLDRGEQWPVHGVFVQRQEYPQVGFTVRTLSDKVLTVILERVTWVRQEVRRMAALLSRKLITQLFMLTNIRLIKSIVNPEHVADLFFAGL